MSGHSKWSKVKHKKAGTDAKRGALFSKLSRMITVAAREGGGDPKTNAKLRQAIDQARASGLPKENIERAISRAGKTGEEANLVSREYEAYGPQGSAFLILAVTDNPNRTTNEIKNILSEFGGKLAEAGSVAWLFKPRAIIELDVAPERREEMELKLIDWGVEDIKNKGGRLRLVVQPEKLGILEPELKKLGLNTASSLARLPQNTLNLERKELDKALALKEALENHPDVTEVWTNIKE